MNITVFDMDYIGKDIDISHRKMSQFKRAYIKRLYESSNA